MRPENIHAEGFAPPGINSSTVQAEVVVTELLGNETIAYLELGSHEFLARFDPRVVTRPGQNINLAVDIDRVHIFDPESEDALGTAKPQTAQV
jgi:multiple sugar transport system ATP-binding protein